MHTLTCDSVLCVCVCSRAEGSGSYRERLGGHHLEFKYFTHSLYNSVTDMVPSLSTMGSYSLSYVTSTDSYVETIRASHTKSYVQIVALSGGICLVVQQSQ